MPSKKPQTDGLPMRWPKSKKAVCVVELDGDVCWADFIIHSQHVHPTTIVGLSDARKLRDRLTAAIEEAEKRGLR